MKFWPIFILTILFHLQGLVYYIIPEELQWPVYGFLTHLSFALAFITWSCVTSYKHVEAKSLLWITAGITTCQTILYWPVLLLELEISRLVIYAIGTISGLVAIIVDYRRRLTHVDDRLNNKDLFELCKRPDKPLHLFMSWWSPDPGGGRAFYVNGVLYRFRKDYFVKMKYTKPEQLLKKYMIRNIRTSTEKDVEYLESKLGSQWKLFHNDCVKVSRHLRRMR